jgi:hypothetical protein
MPKLRFIALALTGTALATVSADAGGLLGGGAANCLCQAANGLTSGSSPVGAASVVRGLRQNGVGGRGSHGTLSTNRSIAGNATGSVNSALNVTVARSADKHSGRSNANIGLAGRVSGASGIGVKLNGVSRSVGLAGTSSAHGSASKRIGLPVAGLAAAHGKSMAGQVANVSVLNKQGGKGHALANVALLNGSGGTSGKLANVSILNKTGTTGRPLANVAVLNGKGGTSGKIANVAILNKTGTSGSSLANVAALNSSSGGTGRLANVSVLNGHRGQGHGNGGLGLPSGVQIINGVPCGPDGKPLTGAAATSVLAMIGSKGGHGGSNHDSTTPPAGNSGNSSAGNGSGGSQTGNAAGVNAASGSRQSRERDMADRKDLWWPPHNQSYNPDGRLNDH